MRRGFHAIWLLPAIAVLAAPGDDAGGPRDSAPAPTSTGQASAESASGDTAPAEPPRSATPEADESEPDGAAPNSRTEAAPEPRETETPARATSSPGQQRVFEGRTGTFEFVAADQGSLQVARRIGRKVLDVCDELITPPEERIPRISVKLAPEGRGNLEGATHRLYEDIAGDYGLAVGWNENLSVALFTQALVESYLKQLVYTLTDRERAEEVPAWLIAGASLRVQVALRPAMIEFLRRFGRNAPMISLEDLFVPRRLDELSAGERIASFWFLELLERTLDEEKRIRAFFDAVVSGGPPLDVLRSQTSEGRAFANGIEVWWVVGFQDLVHRETGIVLSVRRSGKQLFLLNRFELIEEGSPNFTTAAGLWDYRDNPVVQRVLTARLEQIRSLLPRANPVFYNCFRSLGLQIEALIKDDREAFEEQSADFDEELRIATAIAKDVQALADNPSSALP